MNAEMVQEYAKHLIYLGDVERLNNQWVVSYEQYKRLKCLQGKVNYICCDSPLLVGLFYNRYHVGNVSNVEKTEQMILAKMHELHPCVYIFLERNEEFPFESSGRVHGEEESKIIDTKMRALLGELGIEYLSIKSDKSSVNTIVDYVLEKAG